MSKNKRILVTGGSGFIGSSLIRFLIKDTQDHVLNLDKLTYAANPKSLESVKDHKRYKFKKIDICNYNETMNAFDEFRPNILMHLAAESHVDNSIKNANDFIQTNILGTFNLLDISLKYWELNKDFLFHHISTDEVYGDLTNDEDLFSESTPYDPSSPYSASKASSDHLVRAWNRTHGLPAIITNCSNNYGPFQHPEKLIPKIISCALNKREIPIYGSGNQIRDWLYVDDHVKALYQVISKGVSGDSYNIGSNNEKTNIEVAKLVCEILDILRPINNFSYKNLIAFVKDRPGHDRRYGIDASKINSDLNWKGEKEFETGIHDTVKWFLENEDWLNVSNLD